jgi:FtsH-binding integral membrane protein
MLWLRLYFRAFSLSGSVPFSPVLAYFFESVLQRSTQIILVALAMHAGMALAGRLDFGDSSQFIKFLVQTLATLLVRFHNL